MLRSILLATKSSRGEQIVYQYPELGLPLADVLTPQRSDAKFELWIDDLVFLGNPVHQRDGQWIKKRLSSETSPMTMFHLVFAVDVAYKERGAIYDVITQLTFALTYEQARSDYVWKACEEIMSTGDSALASVIRQTYDALSRGDTAHLVINQINLSLSIPREIFSATLRRDKHVFLSSVRSFGEDDGDPLLLPHWALLLLDDPETILGQLPPGSSPMLIKFVKAIRPTMSFSQLGLPLHDVSTLARHLVHWRFALPIRPLHVRNVYTTSPTAVMSRLHDDTATFSQRFPTVPSLPRMLTALGKRIAPFSALVPSKDHRALYLDVLAWLLRRGWLIELRTFVWIKVPAEVKRAVRPDDKEVDEETVIAEPYAASAVERKYLSYIAALHPEDQPAFDRMVKYFNGNHAMEKVLVRENLTRKTVRRVLEVYDDYLIKQYTW
ncbi:Nitrogen permease regulator 3 [Savitreella phatthalungensis]